MRSFMPIATLFGLLIFNTSYAWEVIKHVNKIDDTFLCAATKESVNGFDKLKGAQLIVRFDSKGVWLQESLDIYIVTPALQITLPSLGLPNNQMEYMRILRTRWDSEKATPEHYELKGNRLFVPTGYLSRPSVLKEAFLGKIKKHNRLLIEIIYTESSEVVEFNLAGATESISKAASNCGLSL